MLARGARAVGIKISINDKEVTNPLLRFVITLVTVTLALLIISVVLFLVLPVVWLAILWLVILILSLPLIVSSLMRRHRDMSVQRRIEHKRPED